MRLNGFILKKKRIVLKIDVEWMSEKKKMKKKKRTKQKLWNEKKSEKM